LPATLVGNIHVTVNVVFRNMSKVANDCVTTDCVENVLKSHFYHTQTSL